jgi:hypothetical protein
LVISKGIELLAIPLQCQLQPGLHAAQKW